MACVQASHRAWATSGCPTAYSSSCTSSSAASCPRRPPSPSDKQAEAEAEASVGTGARVRYEAKNGRRAALFGGGGGAIKLGGRVGWVELGMPCAVCRWRRCAETVCGGCVVVRQLQVCSEASGEVQTGRVIQRLSI
eukprot:3587702-Rhodomonas_salina.1